MKIKDHMDITDYAVDLYWMFSTTQLADTLKNNINTIKEGTKSVSSRRSWQRTRTWHFFNNENRFKPWRLKLFGAFIYTVYPTPEQSLRGYVQELRRDISDGITNNSFYLIGKILHLVQDMSSPANVVPIYHSYKRSDSFEIRLNSKMALYLSNFHFNQDRFNKVCECGNGSDCIETVYQDAALRTLERIQKSNSEFKIEVDGETRNAGWDLFWSRRERAGSGYCNLKRNLINGFGSYGPLGRHFGQERVEVSSRKYVIRKDIYDNLCNYIVNKSIEDSLRVLVCIDSLVCKDCL